MTIASRLRKLELDFGSRDCAECGGKGLQVISWRTSDEPVPEPQGCPTCGEVFHVVVTFHDETLPGRPRSHTRSRLSGIEMADAHT